MPVSTAISPNKKAVEKFSKRTPVASRMSSKQWQDVSNTFKDKAFFSARVNDAKVLSQMRSKIDEAINFAKKDPNRAFMNRGKFVGEMKEYLSNQGYITGGTSLTDITSNKRLSLIYKMNEEEALGFAQYKADMANPMGLSMYPAWEFVRQYQRRVERNWQSAWTANGGKLFNGRMIALKTDPIWTAISRFKKPYPPFDFNSGMGLKDVPRKEAEGFGLLEDYEDILPDENIKPVFEASVASIDKDLLNAIENDFQKKGFYVKIENNLLQLAPKQEAFSTWQDFNYPSSKTWKTSILGKVKNDDPKKVETAFKKGELVEDVLGNKNLYSEKKIHWMYNANEIEKKISRLPKYTLSKESTKNPIEVWDQGNQINYLSTYTNTKNKTKGIVTIVKKDGSVYTYFPKNIKGLDELRKGKRIYEQ